MLKELSNIANGLLGLHGYPMQPISWSAPREQTIVPLALPCIPAAPARTDTVVPAALHCRVASS